MDEWFVFLSREYRLVRLANAGRAATLPLEELSSDCGWQRGSASFGWSEGCLALRAKSMIYRNSVHFPNGNIRTVPKAN